MKERPILFNTGMVQAILDGRKTQTRRMLPDWQKPKKTKKIEPNNNRWMCVAQRHPKWGFGVFGETEEEAIKSLADVGACPLGGVGEHLWVRETFGFGTRPCPFEGCVDGLEYKADEAYIDEIEDLPLYTPETPDEFCYGDAKNVGWKPSIHMPRWASRITLEITDVRIERLQDISEEDAVAEGVSRVGGNTGWKDYLRSGIYLAHPRDSFLSLWSSIYANSKENPYVWVVEFKVRTSD